MTDHTHTWIPIPLECGEYRCACGVSARRVGREIRPYKSEWRRRTRREVAERAYNDVRAHKDEERRTAEAARTGLPPSFLGSIER